MIHTALALTGAILVLLSLPGSLELALLTFSGILPARKTSRRHDFVLTPTRNLAVVIPAHNEALNIAASVASLAGCIRPPSLAEFATVVIADNCTDATATIARDSGAHVIERFAPNQRGKGYALQYAFDLLVAEGFDAFLVIDADTVVEANLLVEVMRLLESGADGVQTRYGVLNPEASIRTRLMKTALMAVNVLRPRGRDRLGLSVGILGNGFALSAATLAAVPYDAHSVVEDLEYSLRIVRSGRLIAFADATTVRGMMPGSGPGVATQRARWEGGRLAMIRQNVPGLLRDVIHGRVASLEPLLDLLLLPLAFHVVLLIAALVIPFSPSRIYAVCALMLLGFHICAAIVVGDGDWRDFAALLAAPPYTLWKLSMVTRILKAASIDTPWMRTER